jgi:hypothetical protein
MSAPHVIRLRGPWEFQTLEDAAAARSGRVPIPAPTPALLADYAGAVRFTRRFQRPTGLENGARVKLVIENLPTDAVVALNREPLDSELSPARWEIAGRLNQSNALTIEFAIEPGAAIEFDVRLEILGD